LVIAVGGAVAAHVAGPGPAAPASRGLLHVRRAEIVDGKGRPVVLHAVAFGNAVWGNVRIPRQHHDESDYARLKAMGMNAVRFYMNYRTFESDDAPGQYLADGWQWLDDNIAWANEDLTARKGPVALCLRADSGFSRTSAGYVGAVARVLRSSAIALFIYGGLILLTWFGFSHTPTGFVPPQDKQYLVAYAQLPDAATLDRT